MKVILAGHNIDLESLKENTPLTPETISAAYARISRDPKNVSELRAESRKEVEKARNSNKAIVFGMSHHSVAEHAYFNFDILDISRLALEDLEARRIGSAYTEKSQRYITLDGDYLIPEELSSFDEGKFKKLIGVQNDFYFKSLDKLVEYQYEQNPELAEKAVKAKKKGVSDNVNRAKNTLEGWAKEDARYALSLAIQGQVGVSFNARTLEHAIRNMRYSELSEVRELSKKLYKLGSKTAPSLIILSDPREFKKQFKTELKDDSFRYTKQNLREAVKSIIKERKNTSHPYLNPQTIEEGNAKLFSTNNIDKNIAAALIHNNSDLSFRDSYKLASNMLTPNIYNRGEDFFKQALQYISEFDALPREFEFSGDLKYEIIVSASNFAQLKRHRLMTLLSQDYNPKLGYTIPESIKKTGMGGELIKVLDQSTELYKNFKEKYNKTAEYCLTNAHRRRVLVSVNPRELYHISRLREDKHAQWDIRDTAHNMLQLAKQQAPLTFMLACGKDKFEEVRKEVYKD